MFPFIKTFAHHYYKLQICHQWKLKKIINYSYMIPRSCNTVAPASKISNYEKLIHLREKLQNVPDLQNFISQSINANSNFQNSNNTFVVKRYEGIPYVSDELLDGDGLKVFIETYGCYMNENDTQLAYKILSQFNYTIAEDATKADIVLLMTCSIREKSELKIFKRLRQLKQLKKTTSLKQIGVLGCMAERLKTKLIEKEGSVDIIAGPDNYKDLPKLLAINKLTRKNAVNVLLSMDETYSDIMPVVVFDKEGKAVLNNWHQFKHKEAKKAFISIMRGCNNMCSYCVVPFTRGRERSREISSIIEEVKLLSKAGVKEITLLGQNVNSYRDKTVNIDSKCNLSEGFKTLYKPIEGGLTFDMLLDEVASVDPEIRIRFTSPHPKDFPESVLKVIKKYPNICKSIHLPAQSGDDTILEKMRRGYTKLSYMKLVDKIRSYLPNVALSSDIICGFCDETQKAHNETLDLINKVKYQKIFVFAYSMRERTHAFYHFTDNIPQETKVRRVTEVYEAFEKHALELNKSLLGSIQLVLIDGKSRKSDNDWKGRNDQNIGVILEDKAIPVGKLSSSTKTRIYPGDYIAVEITKCTPLTLIGKPLYSTTLTDYYNYNYNNNN